MMKVSTPSKTFGYIATLAFRQTKKNIQSIPMTTNIGVISITLFPNVCTMISCIRRVSATFFRPKIG